MILTDDQLHAVHIFWALGGNPFAWDPRTVEQYAEREAAFARRLAENDPDAPWDDVGEALLDKRLGAMDLHPRTQGPD